MTPLLFLIIFIDDLCVVSTEHNMKLLEEISETGYRIILMY